MIKTVILIIESQKLIYTLLESHLVQAGHV